MGKDMETGIVPVEEKKLGTEVSKIERDAMELTISTDADFALAGDAVKAVKAAQKRVEEYWEPMRASTYSAYKAVTDHKKAMTDPLKKAEGILKTKMGEYQAMKERQRREKEEELRRLAMEEARRKLDEAKEAKANGDEFSADYALAEAEALGAMADTVHVALPETKVDGIAQKKAWTVKNIDLSKLPCEFAGVMIRPADEKAIMRLIRASKGTIKIPGVEYEETVSFAVKVS